MSSLNLLAPAKINLGLRVVGRHPDGYHKLCSLMVPLTVGDQLEVEERPSGFTLRCDFAEIPMTLGAKEIMVCLTSFHICPDVSARFVR